LSDRYFLEQFGRSLHVFLRPIFGVYLEMESHRYAIGTVLPHSFAPHRLLSKLVQRAAYVSRPKLVLDTPRACLTASQAVRSAELSESLWAMDSSDPFMLAALTGSAPARLCFVCASASHLAPECPRLKEIKENAFARPSLVRLLESSAPSPAPLVKRVHFLGNDGSKAPASGPAESVDSGEDMLPEDAAKVDFQ
jgi:hypothetical protein